jgi:hypothetical protein
MKFVMDFEYTIANNQVTITKYTGSSKNVTIPNEIENLSVTTIGRNTFEDNKLTSISLPQTLTTIKNHAFWKNKLTSISLPQNLTIIGPCAFNSNRLTSVSLPQNLATICQCAFSRNLLTSISLPQNLTTIEQSAFSRNLLTSISLLQNLTTISHFAFMHNKLISISLPNRFRTEEQIKNIFDFSLEELDNRNKKFIKPYLLEILEDYDIHYHFHDIIIDYILPSNKLVRVVIEAKN